MRVQSPSKALPLHIKAVPRTFGKSALPLDKQVTELVAIAHRVGLLSAAEFLGDVWEAASNPPENSEGEG